MFDLNICWEANSKIRLLEDLRNLAVNVWEKFEGCPAKTVGGVGFFRVTVFFFFKKELWLILSAWLSV